VESGRPRQHSPGVVKMARAWRQCCGHGLLRRRQLAEEAGSAMGLDLAQGGKTGRQRKNKGGQVDGRCLLKRRRGEVGEGEGVSVGATTWRMEKGALVQRPAERGGRQCSPAVGDGWRRCRANRGRRRAWATRAKGRGRLTRGTEVRWGTRCQRWGAGESGRERLGGDGH
jgi:hypothetical protein